MGAEVAVLDLALHDPTALVKSLELSGASPLVSSQRSKLLEAEAVVLYGAGEFDVFVRAVNETKSSEIIDTRLAGGKPVFAVGLGFTALFEKFPDGPQEIRTLGQWPGEIETLEQSNHLSIESRNVLAPKNSKLFEGLARQAFFFDNTLAVKDFNLQVDPPFIAPVVSLVDYEPSFIAAVENGPLAGVQFFPERSGDAGLKLLSNWINSLRRA